MRWTCGRCGSVHDGAPLDWSYDAPIYWNSLSEEEREARGRLSEDLCVIRGEDGDDFFIRGVLPIPVASPEKEFRYGVWASLSENSFRRVVDLWEDPGRTEEPPYFGWLSNSIPGYPETLSLKTNVHMRALNLRPLIELEPTDHPLAVEQREGISARRLQELVELHLHEAR